MNAYAFISKVDDESAATVAKLARFSVRTAGAFTTYAAFSRDSVQELREVGERIAAAVPGEVEVLLSVEEPRTEMRSSSTPGWPMRCIDPETGEFDFNCLGSPDPSAVPKSAAFAALVLTAGRGQRDELHARLTLTGNVIGMARLLDPARLLVEVSNPDRDSMLRTVDTIGAMPEVVRTRAGVAVHEIEPPPSSD